MFLLPAFAIMLTLLAGFFAGLYLSIQWLTSVCQRRTIQDRRWVRLWANGCLSLAIAIPTMVFAHSFDIYQVLGTLMLYLAPVLWLIAFHFFRKSQVMAIRR